MKSFSTLIEADMYDFLTVEQMIQRRVSAGGTARSNVLAAIEAAERCLADAGG